jgi:type IV pilus assembly protein PilA
MKDLWKRARDRAHPVEIEGEEAVEAGFTLIELMVVLLIIAILLAIAIPTFLGVTNTANDRAAQANLTNALTEGKALYGVNGAYASANATVYTSANFTSQAPEFTWQTTNCLATQSNCISFDVFNISGTDSQGLSLASYSSKTNTCWYVFDLEASPGSSLTAPFPTAGVWYGKQILSGATTCAALNPNAATPPWTTDPFATGQTGTNYGNAPTV